MAIPKMHEQANIKSIAA